MIRSRILQAVFFTLAFSSLNLSQSERKFEANAAAQNYAQRTVRTMTIDEKIGQMIHIGINARFANRESAYFTDLRRHVVENKIGGIVFFGAPVYETAVLGNKLQRLAKIPLLYSVDAETGIGMRFDDTLNFPWAMALGATRDASLARDMGVITAREAKALGFHQVFAPVVDVNNDPLNPVINVRSFGEDPTLVAEFGAAFIRGVQSQRVLATAKHFPGHGDTAIDSHRGLPTIDLSIDRLRAVELPPFKAAIDAGVASVMVGHIALPQIDNEAIRPLKDYKGGDAERGAEIVDSASTIPATLSRKIQTDLLRNELGFKGLIVSDAMSMSGLTLYFDQGEAGVRAILAGTDILEKPADIDAMIRGIRQAVASGRISQKRLNESVERILAWKHASGAVARRTVEIDAIDRVVSGAVSERLADRIAEKAITLVRHDKASLPLNQTKSLAVVGISNGFDGASTMSPMVASLRRSGFRFTPRYAQENSSATAWSELSRSIDDNETVLFGLYGRVRSGAANSTGIPQRGIELVRTAVASGKRVIVVSFGNPYVLSEFPNAENYIVAYGEQPNLQSAAARAIAGEIGIYGKLPISLPEGHPIGHGITLHRIDRLTRN